MKGSKSETQKYELDLSKQRIDIFHIPRASFYFQKYENKVLISEVCYD